MQPLPKLDARRYRERALHTRLMMSHEHALEQHIARVVVQTGKIAAAMHRDHGHDGMKAVMVQFGQRLRAVMRPSLLHTAREFGDRVVHGSKAALGFETKAFEDLDYAIQRAIDEHVGTRITQVTEDTQATIVEVIRRGLEEGWSEGEIAAAIEDAMNNEMATWRARRIARTETHTAAAIGQHTAAEQSPLEYTKEWLATEDSRTRHDHALANGQKVPMDDPFILGGEDASQGGRFVSSGGNWIPRPIPARSGGRQSTRYRDLSRSDLGAGMVAMMYPGDPNAPAGQVINCFVGQTLVAGAGSTATRYFYTGDVVDVTFANGRKLTGTPNHPVLGPHGWVALGTLKHGDHVLGGMRLDGISVLGPDVQNADTSIEQVFDALAHTGNVERVARSNVDFHGDRPAHDVDIVRAESELLHGGKAQRLQMRAEHDLACTNLGMRALLVDSALRQFLRRARHASDSIVSRTHQALALFGRRVGHALEHGFGSIASLYPGLIQTPAHGSAHYAKFGGDRLHRAASSEQRDNAVAVSVARASRTNSARLRATPVHAGRLEPLVNGHRRNARDDDQLLNRLAGLVELHEVVAVSRRLFAGHVFNLETDRGWYIAEGIIAHNCRCTCIYEPVLDAARPEADPNNPWDTGRYDELGADEQ